METKQWTLREMSSEIEKNDAIREAAKLLVDGSLVAFPTETVYGLGADARNNLAVENIFKAKGRPQDNPLIAHVATKSQLNSLVTRLPSYAERLIELFTPGPITFVLPSNGVCAENVTVGLPSIAVRIPDHPVAQKLLRICGFPIAAPSANLSGKPSPTTADHVYLDLAGKIAGILDGGPTGIGMESTVISCLDPCGPVILRPGGITKEEIERAIGIKLIDHHLDEQVEKPQAPGMKYKHYAPDLPLYIIEGSVTEIQRVIDQQQLENKRVGVIGRKGLVKQLQSDQTISLGYDLFDVAANLYGALRQFKTNRVDIILSESFPEIGIGLAIMNRLQKAATTDKL